MKSRAPELSREREKEELDAVWQSTLIIVSTTWLDSPRGCLDYAKPSLQLYENYEYSVVNKDLVQKEFGKGCSHLSLTPTRKTDQTPSDPLISNLDNLSLCSHDLPIHARHLLETLSTTPLSLPFAW